MGKVGTYLFYNRNTEEAFEFYRMVFGGDFVGGISRYGDLPPGEGSMSVSEQDKELVMHISLPIIGGHMLMGSDISESMGFKSPASGDNVYIVLSPDTKEETERIFNGLSKGGNVEMALHDTFWGSYHGTCVDKFGVRWMFDFSYQAE
jgi:PhnB protein